MTAAWIFFGARAMWAAAEEYDFISVAKVVFTTNTKSLAKEFSKILIFEYFGYLRIGNDVFFDADFESPRMT